MAGWSVRRSAAPTAETHVVTTAEMSRAQDRQIRQRRYFMLQGGRVLCIALQAFPLPAWARIVLIAGAVCLPWMGVVQANAGPSRVVQRKPAASELPDEPPVRTALAAPRVIDGDPVPRPAGVPAEPPAGTGPPA